MPFWRPGTPAPGAGADPTDLDCDSEQHRAFPVFNPKSGLPLQQQRQQLPIYKSRLDLLYAVETHRVVVLSGTTGCGKSTQLPQYLDEAGWTRDGYVVGVTLPRRIAAVALATRVAQEMNVDLGRDVGYRIRFDSHLTPGETRIEFMTEGVLLRDLLVDPLLTRYSVLIIDEAHERSVNTDVILGLLRKIMRKRPQLRLIVSSATADVESFLRFFRKKPNGGAISAPPKKKLRSGWDDATGEALRQREEEGDWRRLCNQLGSSSQSDGAPDHDVCFVSVEGRSHAVQVHYLDEPACDYVETAVSTVMSIHTSQPSGDILVFLTGREEIEAACHLIKERYHQACERAPMKSQRPPPIQPVPLHSSLPKDAQMKALLPGTRGARKVVVSTNIAEASVTIDGIVYVVDGCFVKLDAYCPANGVSYLSINTCSQSSARQRSGRAGRTRPGQCYRLVTEKCFWSALPEHTLPEIVRADLKDVVLLLKCLGVDNIEAFEFVTQPTRATLELALEELFALGAIDDEARVVEPLGVRMAHGPLPLALMRMLLLAAEPQHACAAEAAVICAMLTLQQPWLPTTAKDRLHACQQSFAVYEGDLVTLLNVFRQYELYRISDSDWAKRHLLNSALLDRAARVRRQLVEYLARFSLPIESCGHDVEKLQRLISGALFLNAARRLSNGLYRLCRPLQDADRAPHTRFCLHSGSVLANVQTTAPAAFVVFAEAISTNADAFLVHNTRIRPEWLPELAPHYFRQVLGAQAMEDVHA